MAFKRGYSRAFVTLNQECSDYNIGSKGAFGKCVVEVHNGVGRVMIQAQGLKPDARYSAMAFSSDKAVTFDRDFRVDRNGRCEFRCEFVPDNIVSSLIGVDDILAVGIVADGNKSPLMGYIHGEIDWKKNIVSTDERADNIAEDETEEKIQETVEETIEEKIQEAVEEKVQEAVQEAVASESNAEKSENESKNIKEIIFEFNENIEEMKYYANINSDQEKDIDYIFRKYNKISPFGEDRIHWIKINLRELVLVRENLWKYMNNPFVTCGCRRFKHLVLGRYESGGCWHYVLGVPCYYDRAYRLEASMQKFTGFEPLEGKKLTEGEFCYCLLKM